MIKLNKDKKFYFQQTESNVENVLKTSYGMPRGMLYQI